MDPKYEPLFTPWKVGNVTIKNRVVMLPMEGTNMIQWEAKTGVVKGIDKFYEDRRSENVGLFIPGLIPLISIVGKKWVYRHPEVFEKVRRSSTASTVAARRSFSRSARAADVRCCCRRFSNRLSKRAC